jgi:osmotically-inducible protein OsmY
MGERDRSQSSYYDRNDNEHRDDRDQGQRAQRDWNANDDVRRSQGRDYNEHNDRSYGQSYNQTQNQDRSYGQDRNYGQNYGQSSFGQDRNYGQSQSNYGQRYNQDRNDRDFSQRYNSGGFDAGRYPNYSAWDNRYRGGEHDQWRRNEHDNSYAQQGYGAANRGWQQEQNVGGWYGQDLYRPAQQQGSLHRDWNARGYPYENESRGAQRGYGFGSNYDANANQRHEDDSFGQQLRDGANRVARKVKRVFRGPKGYKRSDDRIREDVSDRLAEQSQVDPSEIEVAVANGDVTLTGSVNSRHEKFLAEEIADDISGVNDVHNQLRVRREQQSHAGTAGGETSSTIANQNTTEAQRRNARA